MKKLLVVMVLVVLVMPVQAKASVQDGVLITENYQVVLVASSGMTENKKVFVQVENFETGKYYTCYLDVDYRTHPDNIINEAEKFIYDYLGRD